MEKFETSNTEHTPSFDEQFARKEKLEIFGGEVEYVDIKPEYQKTEIPLPVAPGWGETIETFKDTIELMSKRGRRVIAVSHSRNGDMVNNDMIHEYPEAELRKAFAILKILEEKSIDKVDVLAHSEGGINTSIAATVQKEKFHTIFFANVAGLIGEDKFPKLVGRFSMNLISEALKLIKSPDISRADRMMTTVSETIKYIAKNPIRSFHEGVAISETQIHEMLKDLHNEGIGVVVMSGVDDPVFPIEKVQEIVKADHLDGFLSVKGGHNEIYANPEEFVPAIDEIFTNMETKLNKTTTS